MMSAGGISVVTKQRVIQFRISKGECKIMRYISDDNKVFETEQECLEHENILREEKY